MTHSHYVMDLYFLTAGNPDSLRREVLRIEARNDDEALTEGRRVNAWKNAHHYDIRAIPRSTNADSKLIYSFAPAEISGPSSDVAIPLPAPMGEAEAYGEKAIMQSPQDLGMAQ